ncbi:MAG TPA: hypothetical protein VIH71_09650 [Solirubrobacteraceae bacterium]
MRAPEPASNPFPNDLANYNVGLIRAIPVRLTEHEHALIEGLASRGPKPKVSSSWSSTTSSWHWSF